MTVPFTRTFCLIRYDGWFVLAVIVNADEEMSEPLEIDVDNNILAAVNATMRIIAHRIASDLGILSFISLLSLV
jgi:hypothetical protein